jgi:hypothetical protein
MLRQRIGQRSQYPERLIGRAPEPQPSCAIETFTQTIGELPRDLADELADAPREATERVADRASTFRLLRIAHARAQSTGNRIRLVQADPIAIRLRFK